MKELYELGIVFRGFVLVKHKFRHLKAQNEKTKDLRGAFISAITTFTESAFNNLSLEYLESQNTLFIFKSSEIKTSDSNLQEPIILYGLTDKKKKDTDKFVKKFLEKVEVVLRLFISRFQNRDFTELDQFEPFKEEIENFFN
ncbi:MAG: hypothetical protein ACFFDX_06235, partial [Candidatus Odinarchaeota archaeon]